MVHLSSAGISIMASKTPACQDGDSEDCVIAHVQQGYNYTKLLSAQSLEQFTSGIYSKR